MAIRRRWLWRCLPGHRKLRSYSRGRGTERLAVSFRSLAFCLRRRCFHPDGAGVSSTYRVPRWEALDIPPAFLKSAQLFKNVAITERGNFKSVEAAEKSDGYEWS